MIFDAVIVLFCLVSTVKPDANLLSLGVLRLARMLRVLRVLRCPASLAGVADKVCCALLQRHEVLSNFPRLS